MVMLAILAPGRPYWAVPLPIAMMGLGLALYQRLSAEPAPPGPSSFWSDQYGVRIQYVGDAAGHDKRATFMGFGECFKCAADAIAALGKDCIGLAPLDRAHHSLGFGYADMIARRSGRVGLAVDGVDGVADASAQDVVGVVHDAVPVVATDECDRHDRCVVRHRHPGEAGAVAPMEAVLLPRASCHLTGAAGEHDEVASPGEDGSAVLVGAVECAVGEQ